MNRIARLLPPPGLARQCLTLTGLALVLALAVNALRPAPLPLASGLAPLRAAPAQARGAAPVSPREARVLFDSGQALFIDARDPAAFRDGAVPGAANFPPGLADADLAARLKALPPGRTLVVYCDGLGCGLGRTLAERMAALGADRVALMADGLEGWLAAGGPLGMPR